MADLSSAIDAAESISGDEIGSHAQRAARKLRVELDSELPPGSSPSLAFAVELETGGELTAPEPGPARELAQVVSAGKLSSGIIVVDKERLVVGWWHGNLKPTRYVRSIPFTSITSVRKCVVDSSGATWGGVEILAEERWLFGIVEALSKAGLWNSFAALLANEGNLPAPVSFVNQRLDKGRGRWVSDIDGAQSG